VDLVINGVRLTGKRYGVGRYIEYLLHHWRESEHPFDRIVVYTPRPLEESVQLPARAELRIVPTRNSDAYWEQLLLPRLRRRHDLLFCPSYVAPLLGGGKTVLTHLGSYEVIPDAYPALQRWKNRWLYQLSARRADRVITVSESSKTNIVRFYGLAPEKIDVIYLGVDPIFRPIDDSEQPAAVRRAFVGDDRPFILFVGKLSKRRHIPELIGAFARLKRAHDLPHSLLLVGTDIVEQNVHRLASERGVEADVIHREFVSHEELPFLYNAADLFIYPSAYEGFGIPVLESMACGTPTITLRNSSFLEFATDVAYLADDGSEDVLLAAMEQVLFSEELRSYMRAAGPERAKAFGWASIARDTMKVLADVAKD
jgi:glycosyltransferase involved in cell wall biosynthesis